MGYLITSRIAMNKWVIPENATTILINKSFFDRNVESVLRLDRNYSTIFHTHSYTVHILIYNTVLKIHMYYM